MDEDMKKLRLEVIEEVRACLTASTLDFKGKGYDETYGEVDEDGLTMTTIHSELDKLKDNPLNEKFA